ncbi:DISARM system helicase DrmA [Conexibacter sp. S30A1]|uniref:DISARM system helicase DrmA n=1 Tax=Conexibacter sp. S30A1 TaxID=2937800 RepID=UPI00200CDAFB|nr:DISARM system helicase DrmA [Conexibacter sp. S30A1]
MPEPLLTRGARELRSELEQLIREDLIGPAAGPQEELDEAPVDRYLLGLLAPRFRPGSSPPAPPAGGEDDPDGDPFAAELLPEDDLADGGSTADEGEEGRAEDRPPAVEQLVPSSFGLTFAVDAGCEKVIAEASWGTYERQLSAEALAGDGRSARRWRRRSCGGQVDVPLSGAGPIEPLVPDPSAPEVVIRGVVRRRGGELLVSLFLVNGQQSATGRSDSQWLCQASLTVAGPGGEAVFVRRSLPAAELAPEVDREELAGLEMLFRDRVELAVGHGVGVRVSEAPGRPGRAVRIATEPMPGEEVPRTDAPTPQDFTDEAIRVPFTAAQAALDMKTIAETDDAQLPLLLGPLADAYAAWIDLQERRIDDPGQGLDSFRDTARDHIAVARAALARIRAGIEALADPDVAAAFRFANHAMWQQRVHTLAAEARRGNQALKLHAAVTAADVPSNRSWRPFQLAFVLLSLPSLADPLHADRSGADALVELLFFPTGGGKTEAYLGLTAFALAIRRLQGVVAGRDGSHGVAVLMRYTLRLLTLQQFQRAAALLCACELRRRALYSRGESAEQRRWGKTPMRIGLWVGQASTPNSTEDAERWVRQARQRGGGVRGSSPLQLTRCPWCGSALEGGRDVEVDSRRGRTLISCSDIGGECAFTPRASPGEGLPVVVVDEEVYRLLPALVIATVDKLARMPWEGRVQALFGQVRRRCERHGYLSAGEEHPGSHPRQGPLPSAAVLDCEPLRPPDLIIQDELHLISGPLGSLVGLYETAVDELCCWPLDGQQVRPKVIASTATIRRAGDQVARLFDRHLAVFPPPGLDARDSLFALQRDQPSDRDERPGRLYLGVCAPGRRFKQVLIRTYVAQLRAAWTVLGRQPGSEADAYMTLVGYFNSLRELGGMRRLVEDDIQSRMFGDRGGEGRGRLIVEELTSRKTASDIPDVLDRLGLERPSQQARKERRDGELYSIDVLLATNMISVGVDVPRLGAMVVAGQPKSTSEYIQATSRVGRRHPGLVLTVYNWARPRDLSHYETFAHYHRTLYRQVEAFSVTPFAPRALDRGLTGVLASLLRLGGPDWNANAGAAAVDPAAARARAVKAAIRRRAERQLAANGAAALAERLDVLLDAWRAEASVGQRTLVYQARGKSDTDVSLLHEPGIEGWSQWTVPTSMRNVELAVPLKLRPEAISAPREAWEPPLRSAPLPKPDGGR